VAINDDADELQLELRAPGKVAGFLRFGKPAVNVGALARDQRVPDVQVGLQAGVENVANLILGRIHSIDHAHQERLSSRDGDFAILSGGVLGSSSLGRQRSGPGSRGRDVFGNYRRLPCFWRGGRRIRRRSRRRRRRSCSRRRSRCRGLGRAGGAREG
jgi:hypothetical protein